MGYGNCVLVNDTRSNQEVIGDSGIAYRGADGEADLQRKMQQLLDAPSLVEQYRIRARQRAQTHYRWEDVVQRHAIVYQKIAGGRAAIEEPELAPPASS
jgi:glycosyltransferase involved in cell wall biosynthesis